MALARVQVQLAPIGRLAATAAVNGQAWLTEAESRRLQGMRSQSRRDSFLAGHWQARKLAARWLGVKAARIALGNFADGRPAVQCDGKPVPLSLSLSHSGEWLALALGEVAVGLDVELPRRSRDLDALARSVFSPADQHRLQAMAAEERAPAFFELWALHEARGKRSGEGMQPGTSRTFRLQSCGRESAQGLSWRFRGGAVALATTPGMPVEFIGESPGEPAYWRYT